MVNKNKSILITGASGSIGLAISKKVISNGYDAVLCYNRNDSFINEIKDYSKDYETNLNNIDFFEKFENTIELKNKKKELPDIEGIESIECMNCGSMVNTTSNTAEFDIQIQIKYIINYKEVINETNNS